MYRLVIDKIPGDVRKHSLQGRNLPEVKVMGAETSLRSSNPGVRIPERAYVHTFRKLPQPRGYPALEQPYRPYYLEQPYTRPDPRPHYGHHRNHSALSADVPLMAFSLIFREGMPRRPEMAREAISEI